MSAFAAIPPIEPVATGPVTLHLGGLTQPAASAGAGDFGRMLMAGLQGVEAKLNAADSLVQRFAVDDSVPVHQVTMALEEARLSVELAMQVRSRLIEGFRELMNMPL